MRHYVTDLREYSTDQWGALTRSKRINKDKDSLWFFDTGAVVIDHSVQYTALNKHTNNQWFRWAKSYSFSVKKNTQGRFVPTHRTANGRWFGGQSAANSWVMAAQGIVRLYEGNGSAYQDVSHIKKIPVEDIEILKTMIHDITNPPLINLVGGDFRNIPNGAFQLVQEPDPAALVRRLFGKTRYRKDLVRTVAQKDMKSIMAASAFRGLVPTDWIVRFLENSELNFNINTEFSMNNLRPVVRRLDHRALRHLLNAPLDAAALWQIRDIVRFNGPYDANQRLELVEGTRPRTWVELHDIMWPNRNRFARGGVVRGDYAPPPPKVPKEIKPSKDAMKIHEAFEGTKYTHIMPENSTTLEEWSDYMGNCIRGYDAMAADHRLILGAVVVDGKMVVNYEVSKNMECRQLLGRFNRPLDKDTHDEVRSILEKAGVLFPEYYAGQVIQVPPAPMNNYIGQVLDNIDINW